MNTGEFDRTGTCNKPQKARLSSMIVAITRLKGNVCTKYILYILITCSLLPSLVYASLHGPPPLSQAHEFWLGFVTHNQDCEYDY